MRGLVHEAGLDDAVELDSAGTGGWHVGSPPDERATETARARGILLEGAARQVRAADFEDFDLILAMDGSNLAELRRLAPDEQAREKVRRLREFDPASKLRTGPTHSMCPIPTTEDHGDSRTCSTWCGLPVPVCSMSCAAGWRSRPAVIIRPQVRRSTFDPATRVCVSLPPGATDARRVGGGDINEAWRVTLADGSERRL